MPSAKAHGLPPLAVNFFGGAVALASARLDAILEGCELVICESGSDSWQRGFRCFRASGDERGRLHKFIPQDAVNVWLDQNVGGVAPRLMRVGLND